MCERTIPRWAKFIILFGIEFNVRLYNFVTLRKIVFLILCFYLIKRWRRENVRKLSKSWLYLIFGFISLMIYGILLNKINYVNGTIPENAMYSLNRPVLYLLYILVFPYILTLIFVDLKDFCIVQTDIMLFQSLIAILGKWNLSFSLFIYNNFYNDDGRMLDSVMRRVRVPCIDMGGATASVVLFAGCICCIYLLCRESNKALYLIKYMIIMCSMIFIGRTGLYFSVLLLFAYFISEVIKNSKLSVVLFLTGLMTVNFLLYYIFATPDTIMKKHYMDWVGEILIKGIGEGSTVKVLSDMSIPALTGETFWGMSIVRGTSHLGTIVQHDSGYIMNYASVGIPGLFMLYGSIFCFYFSQIHSVKCSLDRWIIGSLLIFIFIFEIKEPFMIKTPLLLILSSMVFLSNQNGYKTRRKEAELKIG